MAAQPRHIVLGGRCRCTRGPRKPRETVLGCALVRHNDFTLLLDELSYLGKVVAQLPDGGSRSHGVRQVCLTRAGAVNAEAEGWWRPRESVSHDRQIPE